MKISEEEKLQLIQVLELRDTDHSQSEDDLELSSSDNNPSSGFSSPDAKLGCTDACCQKISVLNKQEEQENLLIELISKVDDPELKSFYLKKLKKLVSSDETGNSQSQPTPKISLSTTLERFNKTKKEITIKDLQREVNKIKDEIKFLKSENVEIRTHLSRVRTQALVDNNDEEQGSSSSGHNSDASSRLHKFINLRSFRQDKIKEMVF